MVPFDGSELSKAALVKAYAGAVGLAKSPSEITDALPKTNEQIDVVAVSVVPVGRRYARRKEWIDADEKFDVQTVVTRLRQQVTKLVPDAGFEFIRVDPSATAGTISGRLRRKAKDLNASMVFIGSDNAGRIVSSVSSVGSAVSTDDAYDVCIVRHALSENIGIPVEAESENLLDSWFEYPIKSR